MTTTYPGINYAGPSQTTNMDAETGIRYGIISQNELGEFATEAIYRNGRDLGFEQAQQNIKNSLRSALSDYFSDTKWSDKKTSDLDDAVENAFEAIEQDFNDSCSQDVSGPMYLEQDGYAVKTDDHNDLWVLKSPYFTYAQFCSPCAPGACHLGNPLDVEHGPFKATSELLAKECPANRCYCLGHDWFDNGKAPYRFWSVETGEEIMPPSKS